MLIKSIATHASNKESKLHSINKMLCLLLFSLFASKAIASLDTINPGKSMQDGGENLVSGNGTFKFGFFSPGRSKNRYVGIWYNKASPGNVVVWVANRETPITDSSGILSITRQGVLLLRDGENKTVWYSNKSMNARSPNLRLLDSGNLVVREGNNSDDEFLWQSFDYPCDTLLPGMKIGRDFRTNHDKFLTSWKSKDDPGKGPYSLWIDPEGFPQAVVRNGSKKHYRLGPWNGLRFTGIPLLPLNLLQIENQFVKFIFVLDRYQVYYSYEVQGFMMTRLTVDPSGSLVRSRYALETNSWQPIYSLPRESCDNYSTCGANTICSSREGSRECNCLEGFERRKELKSEKDGCVRDVAPLNCTNDVFTRYSGLTFPDTFLSSSNASVSLVECKQTCLINCSCTGYATLNISNGDSGCLLWFGDLIDIRETDGGAQDLFVRISSSTTVSDSKKTTRIQGSNSTNTMIIGSVIGSAMLLVLLITGLIFYVNVKNRRMSDIGVIRSRKGKEDTELLIFDLATIANATNHFSDNKRLGKGGFGIVYKGVLNNGQEIAVKRLSKSSRQGITEFKNEVILIAKLQHRNLVKLLGCCIQGEEKMLIYEFMPNKSLDYFIFDRTTSGLLEWNKRTLIIVGIARGLLYLHQDSRLRIIHRDLKTSNVLLDEHMNPKISDFGMARMFGGDETEANTSKVVGTYGYMSPEYAVDGLFSMKSDVFSFEVIILEVVTGKKNRGFSNPNHGHNLLGHAWKMWMEDKALELVDRNLESYAELEALKCIQVGLLCVQQKPEDRPSMSNVVLMLGSDSPLPQPKQPGFFTERNIPETQSPTSSSKPESLSTNEITVSSFDAR